MTFQRIRPTTFLLLSAALAAGGCLLSHMAKDIPPPGGCDSCHRAKISSNWEIGIAPVHLDKDGRPTDEREAMVRQLREIPVHRAVPDRRLEVFAAAVTPELIGEAETGIQCFVCHRAPETPHEGMRGSFHHPWGNQRGAGE